MTSSWRKVVWLAAVAVSGIAPRAVAAQDTVSVPAGTHIPIRFLGGVGPKHDRPGTPVTVQTMAAILHDACVVVRPFALVRGAVVPSGHRGRLALRFDSIAVTRGRWVPLDAGLDSLEYAPQPIDSGAVTAGGKRGGKVGRALASIGIGAIDDELLFPAAILGGYALIRRRHPARIVAGELGGLRLRRPFAIEATADCVAPEAFPHLLTPLQLPTFVPRTTDRRGRVTGDPINLVVLGPALLVDSAFRAAGWTEASTGNLLRISGEVAAMIADRRGSEGAPVSAHYFSGRRQDTAYELEGSNARQRHHLRLWLVDTAQQAWVAAASRDAGLFVRPLHGTATHRLDPDIDAERDLVVRELIAGGCAGLSGYTRLPGAVTSGRNAEGQRFLTDGRTAVVHVHACRPPTPLPDDAL
ncbi:MAG TPA: LssY C-terminal domain-containing protein [Gemmatimonadales bacterium]|nr:LssY C-terminal domain-containing protein [Gemmatimonadales bacterium]